MYDMYLRAHHWQMIEAEDGRLALASALTSPPHAVVTEAELTGISGFDLCRELRADPATASIPIVMLTGDSHPATPERACACGADAVLVKPCLPDTLREALDGLIVGSYRGRYAGDAVAHDRPVFPARRPGDTRPRRRSLVNAALRHVRTRPKAPPPLVCPDCDEHLVHQRSHVGGVSAQKPEQWDYYRCPRGCGEFQYRHRTRKVRAV
jgi:DNA-binding response OmpR family regulator